MITLFLILFALYLLMGGHFQAQHGFFAHERRRGPDFDQEAHNQAGCGWLLAILTLCAVLVAMVAVIAEGS